MNHPVPARELELTAAQILMSMLAHCLGCGTVHDGYTPCPGKTITAAEKQGIPPLPTAKG
jgi:hypothetical protein